MAIPNTKTAMTKKLIFVDSGSNGTELTVDTLIETMNSAAGSQKVDLGDAVISATLVASDGQKLAQLVMYAALDPADRADALGQLVDNVANPTEFLKRNIDGTLGGEGRGGASVAEALEGTVAAPLPDWESIRDLDIPVDVSGDITSGTPDALEVDFHTNPSVAITHDADLDLSFTDMPAEMLGIRYVFSASFTNDGVGDVDVTPQLSGTGLATVVAMNPLAAAVTVPAGDTVLFLATLVEDGTIELSISYPTP